MKLQAKFLVPTITLVLVAMSGLSLSIYILSADALNHAAEEDLAHWTSTISDRTSDWIEERRNQTQAWSKEESLVQCLKTHLDGMTINYQANKFFSHIADQFAFYTEFRLMDPQGEVIASSNEAVLGRKFDQEAWFKEAVGGKIFESRAFWEEHQQAPAMLMAIPVLIDEAPQGVLFAKIDLDFLSAKLVESAKVGQTGYAFIFQEDGSLVAHPDKEVRAGTNLKEFDFGNQMISEVEGMITYTFNGVEKRVRFKRIPHTMFTVAVGVSTAEIMAPVRKIRRLSLGAAFLLALALSGVLVFMVRRMVTRPLSQVVSVTRQIGQGDLNHRIPFFSADEIGDLAQALNQMISSLKEKLDLAVSISKGDLTRDLELASDRDALGLALKEMSRNLNFLLRNTGFAAGEVSREAEEMAESSQVMSEGASEQASSLEQISSQLTELASQTQKNARHSLSADHLVQEALSSAKTGDQKMSQMVSAMEVIDQTSRRISNVLTSIENLAFQTNLLSLNAAVEAARAGKHGLGFGVVAREVKMLAGKSAQAAQETALLIQESTKSVDSGKQIVQETVQAFQVISRQVAEASGLVESIANASNHQAQGLEQVSQGLANVEQVTVKNTTQAEKTARASEKLMDQVTGLLGVLGNFQIKDAIAAPAPRRLTDQGGNGRIENQIPSALPSGIHWGGNKPMLS